MNAVFQIIKVIPQQMRVHQWAKNVLILVPIAAAHKLNTAETIIESMRAFLAFSFVASSIYILNDLCDLKTDRLDPVKSKRPLASGKFPTAWAAPLMALLLAAGFTLAFALPLKFINALGMYLFLNLLYSFWLKRIIIVDVVFLASMYTLRILVGCYATGMPISRWLLAFSIFFFFSLAMVKRYGEIIKHDIEAETSGRGYLKEDQVVLLGLGATSSLLSILVFVFYISSDEVAKLYLYPGKLWLLIPVLLYWLSRLWILANRKHLSGDPVVLVLKDPGAWLTGGGVAIIVGMALGVIPSV